MRKIKIFKLIFFIGMIFPILTFAKNYTNNSLVNNFIEQLVHKYSFDRKELDNLFSNIKFQKDSLGVYKKPLKKKVAKGSWDSYKKMFLNEKRIRLGASFMKRNRKYLLKAYKKYGVQPEYITAIIGIESLYGKGLGRYPVFDSLVTLSFEKNRRNKFFKSELKEFLLLCKKNKIDPKSVYGSYAGAFGLAQFMPSSFNSTAVDFDKNKKVDLFKEVDAIGSVANYFKRSGWNKNIPVATRVSYKGLRFNRFKTGFKYKYKRSRLVGIKPRSKSFFYNKRVHLIKLDRKKYDELWYGTKNFYVITRYNRSNYYAMAVHQLAKKIKKEYRKST